MCVILMLFQRYVTRRIFGFCRPICTAKKRRCPGLCAAAERARLGEADLEWKGKVLDVAAVRAGWTAPENTGYKKSQAKKRRT